MKHFLCGIGAVCTAVMLSACGANSNKSLYYWGNYPDTVYKGLQNKQTPGAQLAVLQEYLEKAKSANQAVAPGVYAQMGMLYVQMGNSEQAYKAFAEEKTRFPESAQLMDFLMGNKNKGGMQ
ncbi:DUF4810 domain-containing protein [Stenoxybacter acetivorans]|uniref:DUF4810 domain-containing protein n=1 Tax=Stenoxybacter acetivorans TaxID=422441 RepID=UPI00069213ED|nr:DUF4810 domain-containing protein [Stenoxybacter acetivorans]